VTEGEFIREIAARGFYALGGYTTWAANEYAHARLNMLVDLRGLRRRATYRHEDPYLSALTAIEREVSKLSAIDRLALLGDLPPTEVERGYEQEEAGNPDADHRTGADGLANGGSAPPLRAR